MGRSSGCALVPCSRNCLQEGFSEVRVRLQTLASWVWWKGLTRRGNGSEGSVRPWH